MRKHYYPKKGARLAVDANLLGPCGFFCGSCLAYKQGTCLGCRYQAEKRETEGAVEIFCDILNCSCSKNLVTCADCPEHPCARYEPEKSIFSRTFIDYLRKNARKK